MSAQCENLHSDGISCKAMLAFRLKLARLASLHDAPQDPETEAKIAEFQMLLVSGPSEMERGQVKGRLPQCTVYYDSAAQEQCTGHQNNLPK